MKYAPEHLYTSQEGNNRVINEMWTADWWWDMQLRLPEGATIAPVILASDKTQLSRFRGDKSAWPVYLTIGNISKDLRGQVSSHATILLGYIPVGHFDIFSEKVRPIARYRLFHHCMTSILAALVTAGKSGTYMTCADSTIHWILAAYVADYPEQCLVACCMENRCPLCKVEPNSRERNLRGQKRDMEESLNLLIRHEDEPTTALKQDMKTIGLRPVYPPFWVDLPHSDIFQAFTPDLLHQLHKGIFKEHLVKWCVAIIGNEEIDARFKCMTTHHGLRHFKNGISSVTQWTGKEHKEMEKIFLGLVAGGADPRLVRAVRAVTDFIFYSSLRSHMTRTLEALQKALDDFHADKEIFIELGGRQATHFNIPKVHSMQHYVELISRFGSADGFNTESPERLHIDYAKEAYRASNKKDFIAQMTVWLRRQESIDRFDAYLDWKHGQERFLSGGVRKERSGGGEMGVESKGESDEEGLGEFGVTRALPAVAEVSVSKNKNIVRASPHFTRGPRRATEPAHLDFALIRTGDSNPSTDGTCLEGLRVAQVRVIFTLPHHYPKALLVQNPTPLAYIEWFTPFHAREPASDMYIVSRSTRMHRRFAEIIPIEHIVRSCHLLPDFGKERDSRWTAANVGLMCDRFFVNPYIDYHTFCLMKLGRRNCI
ncbi:hypothetical protein EDD15DRAFT_2374582 [Pisolithus albus]|nr:hypothetical protein EDD15DRAFT_2374582 [Pisolithus albus]